MCFDNCKGAGCVLITVKAREGGNGRNDEGEVIDATQERLVQ